MTRRTLVAVLLLSSCDKSTQELGERAWLPPPPPEQSAGAADLCPAEGGASSVAGAGDDSSGMAGSAGDAPGDIVAVKPTAGCGLAAPCPLVPGESVRLTIATSGVKDADATGNPGPWSYEREFYVRLPAGYDSSSAYPMVFQGPGCGGDGTSVYPLPDIADQVIGVGMTPPPDDINHVDAPGAGCFDDREGDDSVDFPFYEAVWDALAGELCFDQNRVFVSGNASGGGAWANQIGCKYAGDPGHPIRAVGVNAGDFFDQPEYRVTCSSAPMAGMWIHETYDGTAPFDDAKKAIERAMTVNGCTDMSFDAATLENYPIGPYLSNPNPDDTCKKIVGCPELYPLVVCLIPGNGHGGHISVANPGFARFFGSFFAP